MTLFINNSREISTMITNIAVSYAKTVYNDSYNRHRTHVEAMNLCAF